MKTPKGTLLLPESERGLGQPRGVDLEVSRRPGYASVHGVHPLKNAKWPILRQPRHVKTFMHGRPNKTFPPVFGTDVPPHGLSGLIRRFAYRYPDHMMRNHTLRLFADRVDSWGYHGKKLLPFAIPALLSAVAVRYLRARRHAGEIDEVERRVEFVPEDGELDVGEIATDTREERDFDGISTQPDMVEH